MKKTNNILCATLIVALVASCTNENLEPVQDPQIPEGYEEVLFSVTTQATKTSRPEDGEFAGQTVWTKGDELNMLYAGGSATATLKGDGGSTDGTFSAVLPQGVSPLYAVYPKALSSCLAGDAISVTIPTVQNGSFGTGNIAVAMADSDNKLAFNNINTLLKVAIGGGVTKITVESVDGSALAGTANLSFVEGSVSMGEPTETSNAIEVNLPGEAGVYYFSILSGVTHSKGFLLKYYKGTDESGKYLFDKSITTSINKILSFGDFEPTNNYYVTVSGAGNKSGVSWANAMDAGKFKNLVFNSGSYSGTTDNDADILKYSTLNGATIHMGAGDYVVASANADWPTIGFSSGDVGTAFSINVIGGYDAAGSATPDPSKNVTAIKGNGGSNVGRLINLEYKSNIHFDGVTFTGNHGAGGGAAAVRIAHGTQHFNNCRFVDNTNTSSACAMHVGNAKAYLTDCVFSGNSSSMGAGVNVSGKDDTYVSLTDCDFTDNEASDCGGAIRVEKGTLEVYGGSFTGNTATNRGGAIYIESAAAKVLLDGSSFTSNGGCQAASPYGQGGAIYSISATDVNIKNCTFTGNTARIAGAIGSAEDSKANTNVITLDGCTFKNNSSTAILFANTGEMNIANSTFDSNTSTSKGGAIACNGWDGLSTVTLTDCIFKDNSASNYGGAIRHEEGILEITGGSFTGNTATKQGGAIYINTTKVSAGIVGATFTSNGGCTDGDEGQGGAIYSGGGASTEISGCTFTTNSARVGGAIGSVDTKNTNTISVDGCEFNGNTSTGVGGAVIITSKGQMTLSNSTFTSNEAGGNGGAIRANDANLTLTMDNVSFNGNYAKGSGIGGALYIENGKYRINRTCFNGNHSTTSGAIYSCGTNTTYLNNCLFTGNYITGTNGTTLRAWSGGATLCMNNCTFADDTYSTSSSSGKNSSWLYVKTKKMIISNSTLIGYSRKGTGGTGTDGGAGLVYFDDGSTTATITFINNIIAHSNGKEAFTRNAGTVTLNATSNKVSGYSGVTAITAGTEGDGFKGNSTYFKELTYVSNASPVWNNCYWSWNGNLKEDLNINKDSATNIVNAINTADSSFKSWLDEVDGLYYDGQGNFRGNGSWWPGAYQGEATTPAGTSIKVMSFNTLYLGYDDKALDNGIVKDIKPERTWAQRAPGCYAMISGTGPDIIGMQECEGVQKKAYASNCLSYGIYGVSRTSGSETGTSEEVPILYKKSVLSVESKGTFWLSSTPAVPGTRHANADAPRPATWAVMKVKATNQKFFFVNAHLSTDAEARSFEIGVLLSGINSRNTGNLPVIITGDQNRIDTDSCFDDFRNAGYTCTRRNAPSADTGITFHAFGFKTETIDNIWQKGCTAINDFVVDRQTWAGVQYISDHYPTYSTIVL